MATNTFLVCWFFDLDRAGTAIVGGKNTSPGERVNKLRESDINVLNFLVAKQAVARAECERKPVTETDEGMA